MKRITRVMSLYQFVLAMVLALYVGFSREPFAVSGAGADAGRDLKGLALAAAMHLWRFLASLHLQIANDCGSAGAHAQRVWEAAMCG